MYYGNRIRQLRKANNYTASQLAAALNVTQPVISNLENNKRELDISILEKICSIFNISIRDFFSTDTLEIDPSFNFQLLHSKLSSHHKQYLYNYMYYLSITNDFEINDIKIINKSIELLTNPDFTSKDHIKINKIIEFYVNEIKD